MSVEWNGERVELRWDKSERRWRQHGNGAFGHPPGLPDGEGAVLANF
jgi:hypothetical protein